MSEDSPFKSRTMLVIIATCSLGLCALIAMIIFRGEKQTGINGNAYFLDLNTKTLFVAPLNSTPPIDAPSGPGADGKPAGVRAHLYRCDESGPDLDGMTIDQIKISGAYIGYLEKRTDAFKAFIAQSETGSPPDPNMAARMVKQPNLISDPEGIRWVPDASPEGRKILQKSLNGCPGSPAIPCQPQ